MDLVSSQETKVSANIPGKDDHKKLFVGGLNRQTTDKELRDYFSQFGNIESVSVKIDQHTGQSRGFGFIVFSDSGSIDTLLKVGEHILDNKRVDPKRVSKNYGKIFVGGLTPELTDEVLKKYFSTFGDVIEVKTPRDEYNQRRAYCFVTFETKDVALGMLKTPQRVINGVKVDVKKVLRDPASNVYQQFTTPPAFAFGNYPGGYSVQGLLDYTDPMCEFAGYDYGYTASPHDGDYGVPMGRRPRGNFGKYQRH